jgi:hypothetical protein
MRGNIHNKNTNPIAFYNINSDREYNDFQAY